MTAGAYVVVCDLVVAAHSDVHAAAAQLGATLASRPDTALIAMSPEEWLTASEALRKSTHLPIVDLTELTRWTDCERIRS